MRKALQARKRRASVNIQAPSLAGLEAKAIDQPTRCARLCGKICRLRKSYRHCRAKRRALNPQIAKTGPNQAPSVKRFAYSKDGALTMRATVLRRRCVGGEPHAWQPSLTRTQRQVATFHTRDRHRAQTARHISQRAIARNSLPATPTQQYPRHADSCPPASASRTRRWRCAGHPS